MSRRVACLYRRLQGAVTEPWMREMSRAGPRFIPGILCTTTHAAGGRRVCQSVARSEA
jgi:hypothetical protein